MSQQAYVTWYTDNPRLDPVQVCQAFISLLGVTTADYVYRSNCIARSLDDPNWELSCVGEKVAADQLPALLQPNTHLSVDADLAPFGTALEEAIRRGIPAEILGDFIPDRPFFNIGEHYFADAADELDREIRYRAMVGCWGYSTPADWEDFRREFQALPFVREISEKLKSLLGEMKVGIYFYF
ncbi:hypothetical protein [Lacipirellula sp.]|uniref:hypothetical protein n=1 Tax=Lacipirellula sp. TaxID=2691419 RepID=UPI003D1287C0